MQIILAIVIGGLFGFVLQKAGAANPEKIINMLRLKDFHLMKVILFAIGFSSLILFLLMSVGIMGPSHLSVKTSYVGVIVGGCILGVGWAMSGFCPGTGVVAAGAGRKDALFFILGGLLGAFLFSLIYGSISSGFLFAKIGGGSAVLANTGVAKHVVLIDSVPGVVVAGGIALLFMIIAWILPASAEE